MTCFVHVARNRHRSVWICFAALLASYCPIGWSAEGELRPSFSSIERQRIDSGALWGPREKQNVAPVEASTSVLQWLIAGTPLPVAEESARAEKRHLEVLAKYSSFDAPVGVMNVMTELVESLPTPMRPKEYGYTLTVVDAADTSAFTVGAGRIYIGQSLLNLVLRDDHRAGRDQVAFVLAHELGHLCLGHVRRLFQREWLNEQFVTDVNATPEERAIAKRFRDDLQSVGVVLEQAYSREDDFFADLFAVHLCRNAGFNLENGLDVLRREAVNQDANLLNDQPPREGDPPVEPLLRTLGTTEEVALVDPPSPAHRLRRLRLELDGLVYGNDYGLFELNRETKELRPAGDKSIVEGERIVVCIHGMESNLEVYHPLMMRLAEEAAGQQLRILGFQYPADGSLARSAKFLRNEMRRVGADAAHVDFVCHSAGGLVLRHYVEIDGGSFHRVYFQGTPQHGSDLAALRVLLEAAQFLGDLKLGYDVALSEAIRDRSGQISHDLLPDSLFLAYLNAPRERLGRDRYVIYRGQAMSRTRVFFLNTAVVAAATALRRTLDQANENAGTAFARAAIDSLVVPDEIADGDLCVSRSSALLDGVSDVHDLELAHTAIPRDPQTIEHVVRRLVDDE